jgi:hypothetical protein
VFREDITPQISATEIALLARVESVEFLSRGVISADRFFDRVIAAVSEIASQKANCVSAKKRLNRGERLSPGHEHCLFSLDLRGERNGEDAR